MLLLRAVDFRTATLIRLAGLVGIAWTVFGGHPAPAFSGRGVVVLVTFALGAAAWLAWSFWSCRQRRPTADLFVLALSGGLLAVAEPSSAGSAFTFVASVVMAARAGLLPGIGVAASGAMTLAAGVIVYGGGGLEVLAYSLGFAASALGGSNIRQTELRAEQAELLLAQTQRSHEEQLRTARLEESTRIAREIHDVLAHALAGLVIQLEATDALLSQGASPDSIRERVQRAHSLAREGLEETRRAVGALRGEVASDPAAAIRALVEQYEDQIELSLVGDERRLQGPAGEAAVRVVQEALTNIRKHAGGSEVSVSVQAAEDRLTVSVANRSVATVNGSSLPASGGGYGLQGMRERAAQLHGTLQAGPTEEGWLVHLDLPLEARS